MNDLTVQEHGNYTWAPEPNPSNITYTAPSNNNAVPRAPRYYDRSAWSHEEDHGNSTGNNFTYTGTQVQSSDLEQAFESSTWTQEADYTDYEYPKIIPQLDQWANETEEITIAERFESRKWNGRRERL